MAELGKAPFFVKKVACSQRNSLAS